MGVEKTLWKLDSVSYLFTQQEAVATNISLFPCFPISYLSFPPL